MCAGASRRPLPPAPCPARRSPRGRVPLAGVLLLAVAAIAAAAPVKPPPRRGEAFTFSLRLGPIEGGRARLAIAPPVTVAGRRQLSVLGQAEAVGLARILTQLRDDYRLVLDADTLLPRRMDILETGLRTRTVHAELSDSEASILIKKADGERRLSGRRYVGARDPVAAFLVMRAARLHDGDRLELTVLDGAALYEGHVEVQGRDTLRLDGVDRPAIRLRCFGWRLDQGQGQGQGRAGAASPAAPSPASGAASPAAPGTASGAAPTVAASPAAPGTASGAAPSSGAGARDGRRPPREATLWLSDDALRVPLRLVGETDLGEARVELTSHEAPRRPLPPPARLPGVTEHRAEAGEAAAAP